MSDREALLVLPLLPAATADGTTEWRKGRQQAAAGSRGWMRRRWGATAAADPISRTCVQERLLALVAVFRSAQQNDAEVFPPRCGYMNIVTIKSSAATGAPLLELPSSRLLHFFLD